MSFIEELLAILSFGAKWGVLMALELFLGGLGASAYIVGSSIDLAGKKAWRRLSAAGALLSWPMVGAALVILIIDLGRPEINTPSHLMNVFNNLSSMMAIGATLLMAFLAVSLLTTALWVFKWREGLLRSVIEVLGISLGFGVALYPGLVLALSRGRPFWTSPFLPWLFVVSALCTGLSLVGLAETRLGRTLFPIFSTESEDALVDLSKTLQTGILVQLLVLTMYLISVWNTSGVNVALTGTLARFFWAAVAVGLLVPFAIERYGGRMFEQTGLKTIATRDVLTAVSFILVLLGGVLLRYVILIAGQI
jgi:formate-dependent nitrite reductase membrane component NrfD